MCKKKFFAMAKTTEKDFTGTRLIKTQVAVTTTKLIGINRIAFAKVKSAAFL